MKTKTFPILILFLILFSPSFLFSQVPAYVPTNGLVGYWPFNGNANDESGNGNHGTVNDATLTEDRNGASNSAYSFDGSSSYIDLNSTNGLSSSQGLTMTMWFNWSGPNSWSHQYVYLIAPNPNGSITLSNDGNLSINVSNCNCGSDIGLSALISQNTWYHVSLTYDLASSTLKLYLNGNLIQSHTEALFSYYTTNNDGDRFGNYHFNEYYFSGKIDEGTLFNRALTPTEITALYTGNLTTAGCTNNTACNYNASATQDDGSCTFPTQSYLTCAGTCINDTDGDGICDELEVPTTPAYLPTNGLVGYWPFNGNANDESGNGNNGTVNGATLTTDRNGNANSAYSFDGVDDWIEVADNSTLNPSNITVSAWVKVLDFNVLGASMIVNKGWDQSQGHYDLMIFSNNQKSRFVLGSNLYIETNSTININEWVLLSATISGLTAKIYVNGILESSIALNSNNSLGTGSSPLYFGKHDFNGAPYVFNGKIDDIAIYNRALTPEEITALYTGATNNSSGGGGNATAGTPAENVPAGIPYQAVIRDNNGVAMNNAAVTVRFSLHQGTTSGTVEYQETQALSTNAFGLINTQFGIGTATQGTFANINWSNTTKFIQVEANTGAGYVDMGTQQMMSVPFAIKANESTKVKNAGLPVYADNAAALAGGLVAGDMYRTAAGILMIVY